MEKIDRMTDDLMKRQKRIEELNNRIFDLEKRNCTI